MLNEEREDSFRRWYPGFRPQAQEQRLRKPPDVPESNALVVAIEPFQKTRCRRFGSSIKSRMCALLCTRAKLGDNAPYFLGHAHSVKKDLIALEFQQFLSRYTRFPNLRATHFAPIGTHFIAAREVLSKIGTPLVSTVKAYSYGRIVPVMPLFHFQMNS